MKASTPAWKACSRNQVDGGVFGHAENWHAQLLAQAAGSNDAVGRGPLISEQTYERLDRLRGFRHIERNVYRHLLQDDGVTENLARLAEVFPSFEQEMAEFIGTYDPTDSKAST